MNGLWQQVSIGALGAVAATVITLLWLGSAPVPPVQAPAGREVLHDLQAQVARQGQALARLEREQQRLAQRLASLPARAAGGDTGDGSAPGPQSDVRQVPAGADEVAADAGEPPEPAPAEKLTQAGVDAALAQAIEQHIAALEMERLYLRDRATREGWRESERYNQELGALQTPEQAIRGEYGEAVYDRYLYAMGQGNRVIIASTLQDSPAAAAGIRAGDAVLSYAGQRVFSIRELQSATTGGNAGDSVAVELDRDGQRWFTTVPRGPLGVRLDSTRIRPSG